MITQYDKDQAGQIQQDVAKVISELSGHDARSVLYELVMDLFRSESGADFTSNATETLSEPLKVQLQTVEAFGWDSLCIIMEESYLLYDGALRGLK